MMSYILLLSAAYLLGSIPWGVLASKMTRGIDVRNYGSGSTGMTNVLRTVGPIPASLVFLGDTSKGAAAVLLARVVADTALVEALAGLAAIVGHTWPLFLGFRGGRGLATGLGGQLVMVPWAGMAGIGVFVPLVGLTRYVSLGSVGSVLGTLVVVAVFVGLDWQPVNYLMYTGPGTALIVWNHRGNIRRLLQGTERRLGRSVEDSSAITGESRGPE